MLHQIGVEIVQRDAHALGVILVGAEHNRFLHSICALEELRYLFRNFICAVFEDNVVVKVTIGINTIFNNLTILVQLIFIRPPTIANVCANIDDPKWSKKTVFDSFAQAVGIDRLAEIIDVGYILGFFRCGGHADLRCRGEIVENPAPIAVSFCGATVALIYDNKIKKVLLKQRSKSHDGIIFGRIFVGFVIAGKLLIEREEDLMRSDRHRVVFCKVDFMDRFFQRREVLLN